MQKRHKGWNVRPEIMIPLTSDVKEFKFVKDIVVHVANEEIQSAEIKLNYEVGTMIEVPRAALVAGELAEEAEFFCFGTNDLTQMTFGFSRDDAGKFLGSYYDNKIYENEPDLGRVLPPHRPELRQLLAVPRADRPPRRRTGCAAEVSGAGRAANVSGAPRLCTAWKHESPVVGR